MDRSYLVSYPAWRSRFCRGHRNEWADSDTWLVRVTHDFADSGRHDPDTCECHYRTSWTPQTEFGTLPPVGRPTGPVVMICVSQPFRHPTLPLLTSSGDPGSCPHSSPFP